MEFKVVQKEEFRITGLSRKYPLVNDGENFNGISEMWANLSQEQMQDILRFSNGNINGFLGVSTENKQPFFQYTIGVTTNEQKNDLVIEIPAATWLVFTCLGVLPSAMINLKEKVLKEWLPSSKYSQANIPRIEIYSQGDMSAATYKSELWIPVITTN
ncbi:AraC family transcriptional regulator [Lysinibacillus agricola]|uniref:AraC family transcriptional regulator n=1 Tax=Lysinibacillus agricola TaxID=2590012 RepID=A0ABX7AR09_9BACI|nr:MULTISPECIES: GyrI-like domain-containing protein [Lysinibacillus]KOS64490.1 hypothetical protein AN161_02055 [Lysinibacillus sp. FJAT-14222]QQP11645.1 AraC family transcriptional regulator [Lysinibacillus agricola]